MELHAWQKAGAVVDGGPESFYLLQMGGRLGAPTRFLLGALEGSGVLPLEAGKERPSSPPLEPALALAADDHGVLRSLLAEASLVRPPDAESPGGSMRLWRLLPSRLLRRIRAHLEEARLRTVQPLPESVRSLAAVVPLSDEGLSLKPLHRAIRDVATFHPERFATVASGYARLHPLEERLTTDEGLRAAAERLASLSSGTRAVLWVLPGGEGVLMRFRQRLGEGQIRAAPKNPTLRSLDLALLNAVVFRTVLGIAEPESPGHPHIFAVPSLEELVDKVDAGVFQAGFALSPPPMWELRAVMEAEQMLPPQTLRVDPSPPAGVLLMAPG